LGGFYDLKVFQVENCLVFIEADHFVGVYPFVSLGNDCDEEIEKNDNHEDYLGNPYEPQN